MSTKLSRSAPEVCTADAPSAGREFTRKDSRGFNTASIWTLEAKHVRKMTQKYKIIKELDKGSFGEVSLAKVIIDPPATANEEQAKHPNSSVVATASLKKGSADQVFVIKKIDRTKASDTLLHNEIEAGKRLKHYAGIPKFVETFTDNKFCYLVFEYFNGINMYSYLEQKGFRPMREKTARRIFRQILGCLLFSHDQKVCHRDLKLENILYNPKTKRAKLIDWGLCAILPKGCSELCSNWCGSPDYVCPEILLQQKYSGCKSDVWGLGTILYILLFGQMPFNFKERFHALQHKETHPILEMDLVKVSDSAKDLVKKMLAITPTERITMEDIARHKWVTKKSNLFELLGIKHNQWELEDDD